MPYWMPIEHPIPLDILILDDEWVMSVDTLGDALAFSVPAHGLDHEPQDDKTWRRKARRSDGNEVSNFHRGGITREAKPTPPCARAPAHAEACRRWGLNPAKHVKIAADSIERLRKCDVFRVLTSAPPGTAADGRVHRGQPP